ncbi:MAG: aldehyde ferredoxin oxidoreductase family protein [Deltaproteobacteria bacterium]|nr:MAG: aldehyde ferredoxin oxidoreductase family protein [Deltaproteobacteria bacterium]
MHSSKLVRVDLSSGKIKFISLSKEVLQDYLGGRGLNMRLLFPYLSKPGDPFDPASPIVMSPGLLCGIPSLGSRMNISARSPESGYLGDSNMGGELGAEFKASGIDSLFIVGRSHTPAYLWIHDGEVEIRDATHLWGKDTVETQRAIRKELHDDRVQIGCIGQAGENRVRFAGIRTGLKSSAGRTGMGAAMGAKRLKALAVRGTQDIPLKDPAGYFETYQKVYSNLLQRRWIKALGRWGTPLLMQYSNDLGFLRVRNNQLTTFGVQGKALEAQHLDQYSNGMVSCAGCPAHCRHRYKILTGPHAGTMGEGPEYASIGSMGSTLGNGDLESAIYATELCNRYGIDTISAGSYIAWAMELYQRGIIDDSAVGYPLRWGDQKAIIKLIHQIARREGFGDVLAEGVRSSEVFGNEGNRFLLQIKNLPIEMTDERAPKSFALGMATGTRGACHMRSRPSLDVIGLPETLLENLYGGEVSSSYLDYGGKGRMVWWHERLNALCDALGVCRFLSVFSSPHAPQAQQFSELIYRAFGENYSSQDLWDVGERICTLERLILIGNGLGRPDDTLPSRYFDEPVQEGPAKGEFIDRIQFTQILDEYYDLHGWDKLGVPREATLKYLGLKGITSINPTYDED